MQPGERESRAAGGRARWPPRCSRPRPRARWPASCALPHRGIVRRRRNAGSWLHDVPPSSRRGVRKAWQPPAAEAQPGAGGFLRRRPPPGWCWTSAGGDRSVAGRAVAPRQSPPRERAAAKPHAPHRPRRARRAPATTPSQRLGVARVRLDGQRAGEPGARERCARGPARRAAPRAPCTRARCGRSGRPARRRDSMRTVRPFEPPTGPGRGLGAEAAGRAVVVRDLGRVDADDAHRLLAAGQRHPGTCRRRRRASRGRRTDRPPRRARPSRGRATTTEREREDAGDAEEQRRGRGRTRPDATRAGRHAALREARESSTVSVHSRYDSAAFPADRTAM